MKNYQALVIIEDDQDFSDVLSRSFLRRGYEVKTAANLKDLNLLLKNFHPSHAIVDLKLLQESGLECIKQLHQFDNNMKIVMLTGYASITTTIEAIKLGACYYLAKPASVEDIILAFDDKISGEELVISNKKTSLKNLEWEYIHQALVEAQFNVSKAARMLGLHRRTLARKLEKRHLTK